MMGILVRALPGMGLMVLFTASVSMLLPVSPVLIRGNFTNREVGERIKFTAETLDSAQGTQENSNSQDIRFFFLFLL